MDKHSVTPQITKESTAVAIHEIMRDVTRGMDYSEFQKQLLDSNIKIGQGIVLKYPKGQANPVIGDIFIGGPENRSYIPRKHKEKLEAIISSVYKDQWINQKFSSDYIAAKIRTVCGDVVRGYTTSNILQRLVQLEKELVEFKEEIDVYVQLEGIHIEAPFELGGVSFCYADATFMKELRLKVQDLVEVISTTPNKNVETIEIFNKQFEALEGSTIAISRISADEHKARELAENRVNQVLELLRLLIPKVALPRQKIRIGLKGEAGIYGRTTPAIGEEGVYSEIKAATGNSPFLFAVDYIGLLNSEGISEIGKWLEIPKSEIGTYRRSILRSIHWFSDAMNSISQEHKVLSLITALEAVFSPPDQQPIRTYLAQSAALITKSKLEERLEVTRVVKDSYKLRSAITHGGETEIIDKEVASLAAVTREVILMLAQRAKEFQSQKQLHDWLNKLLLSGTEISETPSESTSPLG